MAEYDRVDPELTLPPPAANASREDLAVRGQALHRYLTQPFRTAEPHTAMPAESVAVAQLHADVHNLLRSR